uniref:RNA polymerase sigma-70 domain-containing protein n=1 Tax=Florenciella parvula TaxID=236787 RepID=A0A7S2AVE8_9STRA|mmetsp:Transcript_10057/g.21202  ORF Transcript_10057/g.21202 Transcript_10057/m.21202 type:complete len:356 (+) Transcript_10057:168-1235(+)|eukprot:CAMPEP_0182527354 /NCGR_PEP_ID=MMETSP1323-20130603/3790_1 /TAXON_ID=236787 /ORGANISM="Florenciella parvula, Strain RCC1693" /LENGTH=355 /DNA_ID=CAMNT_0024736325 /DNA_START=167 /DNA_END=1234 /DNA_ORIENTATION=+
MFGRVVTLALVATCATGLVPGGRGRGGGGGGGGRGIRTKRARKADLAAAFDRGDGRWGQATKKLTNELVGEVKTRGELVRQRAALAKKLDRAPSEEEWASAVSWNSDELRDFVRTSQSSQSALINKHYPLIVSVAKIYDVHGAPFQDLIQEGMLGLIIAAERFDDTKGVRFSTYATYWIRQRISSFVHNNARMIRLPSHVIGMLGVVEKAKRSLQLELGREPSVDELAAASKISREKLQLYTDSSAEVYSLERTLDAYENLRLGDKVAAKQPSPEDLTQHSLLKDELAGMMGHALTNREIKVLKLRYGFVGGTPKSLDEVGAAVSVSRDTVRRIEARALNKLRLPNSKILDFLRV